jgi:hypothetical protein
VGSHLPLKLTAYMNENFASQISEKSDKELLDIFKRQEEYQDTYIDLVEKELQRRELNHQQIKTELDQIKIENAHSNSKRASLSGNKYYAYDKRTRDFGSAMMVIGIVVLLIFCFV